MDFSVSVSCFHDELASTVERALKAAVDTVLCEITKTVGGRFAEKEKENEKLKLRLEMSERELRAVRECMKTLQDVIAQSSAGASNDRPPQDCQLHTPNDSLAFRLPGTEKGFVTEEDRASAQLTPKSRHRDCNPSTARSGPANRDDVNPRFLPVEAFEHIEDAWAPEWGEGVNDSQESGTGCESAPPQLSDPGRLHAMKEEDLEDAAASISEIGLVQIVDGEEEARQLEWVAEEEGYPGDRRFQDGPSLRDGGGPGGAGGHRCVDCGKHLSSARTLRSHRQIHTGEKPHACPTCGKTFRRSDKLRQHQRVHSGEKPYRCPTCGRRFSQSNGLKIHQSTHPGPYPCPACGEHFDRWEDFKTHSHGGGRGSGIGAQRHACGDCGKSFRQARDLQAHRTLHTGASPHRCPECGKCFGQARTLAVHQRIHTGEKPYRCTLCGKSFRHLSGHLQHLRTHRTPEAV
ncbi:zinc finger protein 771-like [Acipenser ruthenus]|uniref:zinc finger protein 771-like n=1 Tax=Acipenser ruthenus TaxID=7906 RepID=UPI002741D0A1|nr:zinc finger protein 771-like [Acipenser ruthenus]